MQLRVRDYISSVATDIDLDARRNARDVDVAVNRCVAAVTNSLKSDTPRFTESTRVHLHQIFLSMRHAHRAVRELLRHEEESLSVNAMPVVRAQVETLYALCLIIEEPKSLDVYLKDGWKKLFIRHIVMREEGGSLPRVAEGLRKTEKWLEQLRITSGVTQPEKQTVEFDELGTNLPIGVTPERIAPFPTPKRVIDKITDPERKGMLMRLYPEYQFLCGFVHFSPVTVILASLLDRRQPFRQEFTSGQITEIYQKEIAGPAMWLNEISVIQCCSEFMVVYPNDIELARCCAEAWNPMIESSFIARAVWERRTQKLLGALA